MRRTEVSSPPEYATTIFMGPLSCFVFRFSRGSRREGITGLGLAEARRDSKSGGSDSHGRNRGRRDHAIVMLVQNPGSRFTVIDGPQRNPYDERRERRHRRDSGGRPGVPGWDLGWDGRRVETARPRGAGLPEWWQRDRELGVTESPLGLGLALVAALCIWVSKAGFGGVSMISVLLMAEVYGARASVGLSLPLLIVADLTVYPLFRKYGSWRPVWRLLPPALVGILAWVGGSWQDR